MYMCAFSVGPQKWQEEVWSYSNNQFKKLKLNFVEGLFIIYLIQLLSHDRQKKLKYSVKLFTTNNEIQTGNTSAKGHGTH